MNSKKLLVLTTILTTLMLLTPLFASAQPSLRYGKIDISFATCNRVVFSYYGDPKGNLRMVLFGPGWSWDNLCSMHDQWQVVNDYTKTDGEYTLKCSSYCSFAQITWNMKAAVKEDVAVLDMAATADSDSNLQAIVLEYSAPVDQFAKKDAYVLLSDGTQSKITFPETPVSGVPSLGSFQNAVAWIVPMTSSEGVVVAVLGENWPFGLQLYAQDEREWDNAFYSLR